MGRRPEVQNTPPVDAATGDHVTQSRVVKF